MREKRGKRCGSERGAACEGRLRQHSTVAHAVAEHVLTRQVDVRQIRQARVTRSVKRDNHPSERRPVERLAESSRIERLDEPACSDGERKQGGGGVGGRAEKGSGGSCRPELAVERERTPESADLNARRVSVFVIDFKEEEVTHPAHLDELPTPSRPSISPSVARLLARPLSLLHIPPPFLLTHVEQATEDSQLDFTRQSREEVGLGIRFSEFEHVRGGVHGGCDSGVGCGGSEA